MIFNPTVCCTSNFVRPNLKHKLGLCKVLFDSCNRSFSYYLIKNNFRKYKVDGSTSFIIRKCVHNHVKDLRYIDFNKQFTREEEELIEKNMIVIESFINKDEEESLLNEIEPYMKRQRYNFSHWDNAIHGYRETERLKWNEENTKIISRVRNFAFPPGSPQISFVHILDLSEDGYIKPHIDAVKFCGNTIAGLSLLTDAVMRLVHEKDKTKVFDVMLKRRSLYVMRDYVRYEYTHEILPNAESKFRNQPVEKKRRISVICRNEPTSTAEMSDNTNNDFT